MTKHLQTVIFPHVWTIFFYVYKLPRAVKKFRTDHDDDNGHETTIN